MFDTVCMKVLIMGEVWWWLTGGSGDILGDDIWSWLWRVQSCHVLGKYSHTVWWGLHILIINVGVIVI